MKKILAAFMAVSSLALAGCAAVRIEMAANLPVQPAAQVLAAPDDYYREAVQLRGVLTQAGGPWVLEHKIELKPSYMEALMKCKVGDEIVVRGFFKRASRRSHVPFVLKAAYYTAYNDLGLSKSTPPWKKMP